MRLHAILAAVHITLYVRDILGQEVMWEETEDVAGMLFHEVYISLFTSGLYSVEMDETVQVRGVRHLVKQ